MNIDETKQFRVSLIKCLSDKNFEEGIALFNEKSNSLSEIVRFECIGDINFYQRKFTEAIRFYEAATEISDEHVIPRYLFLAGIKNEISGNFIDAFKYFQAAIEAEPSFIDSYVELGALLMKVGDFEGALRCYEDAVRLDFDDLSNHDNLKAVLSELNLKNHGLYEEKVKTAEANYALAIARNNQ
jgi:tetratricopeptide (TPR) repeat protein